ncbi:MAG: TetR/AcrR family transcriptional regulator, partial [Myxococcota bacterium]
SFKTATPILGRMRKRILEIATRQMKSGGYESLNFGAIAAELNTSRANLHYHFKNKEGLGLAVTVQYIQEEKSQVDDIIHRNDGDIISLLQELEAHLLEIALKNESSSACICSQLLYEFDAPKRLRELAVERIRAEEKDIESQIRKAKKKGTLDDSANVRDISFRIMATMLGVGQLAMVETSKSKLTKSIRGCLVSIVK